MQDQFVTYEIALLLKKLGYNIKTSFGVETSLYNSKGEHTFYTNYGFMNSGLSDNYIYAPLWQQVIDWFREECRYDIHITYEHKKGIKIEGINSVYYDIEIYRLHGGDAFKSYKFIEISDNYYEAREQAILKMIELYT